MARNGAAPSSIHDHPLMGASTAPVRHTGCRPLRPSEVAYLRTIMHPANDDHLRTVRGFAIGVLLSSVFWVSLVIWVWF
jgi:hypothetical protein